MKRAAIAACLILALSGCGGSAPPAIVPTVSLAPAPTAAPSEIRVYVTGAVARPGVYSLSSGSRVEDAVTAAGGFVDGADMVHVNLAARVRDEEEIFVPRAGEAAPALATADAVDVNHATAAQLRQALNIPATLASKIVSYRRQHGPFHSVDDLRQVPVPDADIERIRGLIKTG